MADTIIGKIRAIITADSSGLTTATNKAEKSLKDLGQQAKKTSRETSTALNGMAGTVGSAFATAKIVQFAKASVTAAGDIAEAVNATRVIFGDASGSIEKFASTAATSLGQSQKQALDAANTFATFGKSAGLAGDDLSKFATDMVRLSSDLASFRNTTPEDAIMAVGAALRGETEPIRRYGVLLNDMTLRQEALALGLVKTTTEALQPQAKVLAAQVAILKQTTDAQGDFARTSGSLSNQIKIANAQFEDLKAKAGEALVPLAMGVLKAVNPLVNAFNSLSPATQQVVAQFALMNATLVVAGRTLVGFGVSASKVGKSMIALNAGFIAVAAVAKIFSAGVEGNTAEVQDFTKALTENDTALRNNALQRLAAEDPQVREYLNTIGEIGLTIGDLAQYYDDLGGPAAGVRDSLAQIANSAFTSKDRLALLNKEFGLNIDVQRMTEQQADATYSRFQNLQFLLFNVEQEWRNNTLSTDAFASALTGVETTAEDAANALGYTAESLDKYRAAVLNASTIQKRELTAAINDTIASAQDFVDQMGQGAVSSGEFVNGLIEQADSLLALQYATKGQTDALTKVTPAMRYVIESMYRAGQAQGYTTQQTRGLINELGLLEGIDPSITIFMTMDIEQLRAQAAAIRKQIESLRMDAFSRNSPIMRDMLAQLEAIGQISNAIENVGDFRPTGGGGGGGGGAAENPFAWVEDWVKDLADFTKSVLDEEFADRLIEMSADDIGKALRDLIEEATAVGISLLDGGFAVDLIGKVSEQLQAAAGQLEGLEGRFADATQKVEQFRDALADLEERFADFRRAEMGIGSYTTLERLDQELAKLEDLKARVEAASAAYRDFRGESVSALDQQLSRLDQLRNNLDTLQRGYESLNESISGDAGLSPLERERKELDALRSSLQNLTSARQSYAQSIEQQAATIQYADRGGALFTAQAWLKKASAFRDVIAGLRDRAFPVAIIRDVLNAGIDGGTKLGRKLLALSDTDLAELKRVQAQISAVAAETGQIAASVLFDADISAADSAFKNQLSLVQQLYQQAIAQANSEFQAQQAIVDGIFQQQLADAKAALDQQKLVVEALFQSAIAEAKQQLADAEAVANGLKTAIEDLKGAMLDLIKMIQDAISKATQQPGQAGGGGSSFIPPDYKPGGLPGQVTAPPPNLVGGTPPSAGSGGWEGLGFDPSGGGYLKAPGGDVFYLPPGIDFGKLAGKARGGSVLAGDPYMVGERGPELFVPGKTGTIMPYDDLAMLGAGRGEATYNITVNARGDASEVGRQVVRAIQEYERRNGTAWRS